jgi:peptidase M41-like protein
MPLKIPHSIRVATAYHEAGHVVMSIHLDYAPQSVSILPDVRGALGEITFPDDPESEIRYLDTSPKRQRYLEERVMRALAGTVAHDLKFPSRRQDAGDQYDYKRARELIEGFVTSTEHHTAYVKMLKIKTRDHLKKYWSSVEAVATALLEHDQLSGDVLREIVCTAIMSPVITPEASNPDSEFPNTSDIRPRKPHPR